MWSIYGYKKIIITALPADLDHSDLPSGSPVFGGFSAHFTKKKEKERKRGAKEKIHVHIWPSLQIRSKGRNRHGPGHELRALASLLRQCLDAAPTPKGTIWSSCKERGSQNKPAEELALTMVWERFWTNSASEEFFSTLNTVYFTFSSSYISFPWWPQNWSSATIWKYAQKYRTDIRNKMRPHWSGLSPSTFFRRPKEKGIKMTEN